MQQTSFRDGFRLAVPSNDKNQFRAEADAASDELFLSSNKSEKIRMIWIFLCSERVSAPSFGKSCFQLVKIKKRNIKNIKYFRIYGDVRFRPLISFLSFSFTVQQEKEIMLLIPLKRFFFFHFHYRYERENRFRFHARKAPER